MKNIYPFSTLCSLFIFIFSLLVSTTEAKKWVVNVQNNSFTPFNLTHVKAGDTIQWEWVEGIHTTTSTSIPQGASSWDNPITQEESSFSYIPHTNGTYFYQCTIHASMGMNGQFLVTGAGGLSEPSPFTGPSIYPNPFQDKVTVTWNKSGSVLRTLRIFDICGKMVSDIPIDPVRDVMGKNLDLKFLPVGLFFFEFREESGKSQIVRVIHK